MTSESQYDIIIAGGGLSGLSLAWYLAHGGYTGKVLVVDSVFAPVNDKTWAFWDNASPPFKDIVYKKWNKAWLSILDYKAFQYLNTYTYYCIRNGDFREYVLSDLHKRPNFDLLETDILDFTSNSKKAVLLTKSGESFLADYIFQSVMKPKNLDRSKIKYPIIQHFLGWEVQTFEPAFDPGTFTLMDFDDEFKNGLGFMYILPYSQERALLEFTVFSLETLPTSIYKEQLQKYLYHNLGLDKTDYTVIRKEKGEIPMEDRPYVPYYEENIINIGSVGGQTKPTTGYTFSRIQAYTRELATCLIQGKKPHPPSPSSFRYRCYDQLLLHIMMNSDEESLRVFKSLFRNNSLDEVFHFLGEHTNILQDLKIMNSVPPRPFLKAILGNFSKG